MKVFVAGATGAVGRPLVRQLVARGHEVVAMTRTPGKCEMLWDLGARPVVADALDPAAVARVVAESEPEVIVHQLTAIPGGFDPRKFDREFEVTNRLRTEGTDCLLSAARAVGVRRFVAQSFGGFSLTRTGGRVKTEEDPLEPNPPASFRQTLAAIRHVEAAVTGATWTEGIVLRYGGFYGPGTSISLDPPGAQSEMVRARKFPILGAGTGVWSFIHVEDAASATVAAIERGKPGIYNIVDDEPAPVSVWAPALAEALGAKPPIRLPGWLGRLVAGPMVMALMNEVRGLSNAKAVRELGWRPRYASWRQGFREGLS